MKTLVRVLAASLSVLAMGACNNVLDVENLQGPDIERVLSSGGSIESVIAGNYLSCRNNAINSNAFQQMQTMSFESGSSLNNFNMGPVSSIPRPPFLNNKSSETLGGGTFNSFTSSSRNAANAVAALDRLTKAGGSIGTVGADLRARAFGFFDIACSLGYLALMYDSAAVVTHLMPTDSVPPLVGYQDVAAGALADLDSAIAVANLPAAAAGFPTPAGNAWMSREALTKDSFIRLMRSWKARIRSGVARSKAERDAVNWAAVLADAENGLTADITVNVGGNTGWLWDWQGRQSNVEGWQQLSMMILGAADATGTAWDNWLSLPKAQREKFVVQTPDKRWPAGATDVAQQASSGTPSTYTSLPYIQNYANNAPLEPWAQSNYRWQRYRYYQIAGNVGTVLEFTKAEVDLLAAEALIRTGNIAGAAARIDLSRVKAGLPALAGAVTSATQLIPGANCVPRMVVGPNFNTTTCADILEAMKYEKRMETAMTNIGAWYFDSRGWQNLYEGTPLYYPVSVAEIDARYQFLAASKYYNVGGGGIGSSPRSLYGFEVR